ncbi:MAG: adenylate/guanylate cyclase domain-containing protein, partial [Actinobacteria bacterium]|nr:adenylate/guanylate cyclase domain-containing protein [Actinomycetota bacterium]
MNRAGRSPRRRRTQPAPTSGTVTLLFTDIVASSLLLQDLGDDRAHRLRRAHFRLLRDALSRHNGREVKSLGDGLMAVFHSAVDAVGCAIEMQQRVEAESSKRGGVPVELRIGLHAGEPVEEERDYFGAPVVLAKRLCDSAYGGGIIASEVVRALVGTRNGFQWEDFQWLALKDTSVPVATYSVVWDSSSRSDQFLDTGHGSEWEEFDDGVLRGRNRRKLLGLIGIGILASAVVIGGARLTRQGEDDGARTTQSPAGAHRSKTPTWRRVALDDLRSPGAQQMIRLARGRFGLLAVGYSGDLGSRDGAVWRSNDGIGWTASESHGKLGGTGAQVMRGICYFRGGAIAVGREAIAGDSDAAAWRTSDGVRWKRIASDGAFSGPGDQSANRVIATEKGLLAVGYDARLGDWDAAVWSSTDGRRWEQVLVDPESVARGTQQEMTSVTYSRHRFVGIGWEGTTRGADAVVWTSPNGSSWQRATSGPTTLGGIGTQGMSGVVSGGPGFVAVGWSTFRDDRDAAIWTSEDGTSWDPVPHDETVFGGIGDQLIWAITKTKSGYTAVGRDGSGGGLDGAVWTSPDGCPGPEYRRKSMSSAVTPLKRSSPWWRHVRGLWQLDGAEVTTNSTLRCGSSNEIKASRATRLTTITTLLC